MMDLGDISVICIDGENDTPTTGEKNVIMLDQTETGKSTTKQGKYIVFSFS